MRRATPTLAAIIAAAAALAAAGCGTESETPAHGAPNDAAQTAAAPQPADPRRGIDSLSALIRRDPRDAALFAQRGRAYRDARMADSAINDLDLAARLQPDSTGYLFERADLELQRGEIALAKTALLRVLDRFPMHIEASIRLAYVYMAADDVAMAKNILNQILLSDKHNARALFHRAMAHQMEGEYDLAIADLMQVVGLDNNNYEAQNNLGLLYSYKHNDLAIDCFANAIRLDPARVDARYNLGYHYQESGRSGKAVEAYEAALSEADSTALDPLFNLGYLAIERNDIEAATRYLERAARHHPNEARVYYKLGEAHQRARDTAQALRYYQRALDLEPRLEEAFTALEALTRKKR